MTTGALKITSKGQVTIPKEIRDRLKSTTIYFEIQDEAIMIKAVRDAGGSLQEYSKNARKGLSTRQMKDKAWEEAVREKTGK